MQERSNNATVDPKLELYNASMEAAGSLLQLNETAAAREFLNKAPEELRAWEWYYLYGQLDLSAKTLTGPGGALATVAISPDGKTVASGSENSAIVIWDSDSGNILKELKGHDGRVSTLAFTPDGSRLISGSTDKLVKVWDIATGREIHTISEGLSQGIYDVEVSSDGKWIALGSWELTGSRPPIDGFAKIYDLNTGMELKKYFATHHPSVKIWDTELLASTQLQVCNDVGPWAIPFNEPAYLMASTCGEEGIRIFEIKSRKEIGKLDCEVFCFMDMDQKGKFLATGYKSNTLTIWDLQDYKKLKTVEGHEDIILDL